MKRSDKNHIRTFRVGDTIKCKDAEDLFDAMLEFDRVGYQTDFLYEQDGVKGFWLEIKKLPKKENKNE